MITKADLPAWVQHADKGVMALRVERFYGQNPRKGMRLGVAEETPERVKGPQLNSAIRHGQQGCEPVTTTLHPNPRGGHGAQGEPATTPGLSVDETPAAGSCPSTSSG